MSIQHENRIAQLERRCAALEMAMAALAMECKRDVQEFEPPPVPPSTLERVRRAIKGST